MFTINHSPVMFGVGTSRMLGKVLRDRKVTRAMFVFDPAMGDLGYAGKIKEQLEKRGVPFAEFSDIHGEPTLEMVDASAKVARDFDADGVIALGGGSSMDVAKGTGLLLRERESKAADLVGMQAMMPHDFSCPVILMPTTAGTSSEVTYGWAVSDTAANVKTGGLKQGGNFAIVDPTFTVGLPPKITAQTGMDLLAHVTESFTNPAENWMADLISKEVIGRVFKYLPLVYEHGDNLEYRTQMSYSCTIAGYAFSNKGTHLGHTIADALSSAYHYPHGVGCCAGTPATIRYAAKKCPERLGIIAGIIGLADTSPESVLAAYRDLISRVGMKSMRELGVEQSVIDKLIDDIATSPRYGASTGLDVDAAIESIREEYGE